jgi:hypothetical protein
LPVFFHRWKLGKNVEEGKKYKLKVKDRISEKGMGTWGREEAENERGVGRVDLIKV